jgi:hypothetical protein
MSFIVEHYILILIHTLQAEESSLAKNGIHINGTLLNSHLDKSESRAANGVTTNGSLRSRK